MGERGPAPKPTALKNLEGNPGKRSLPKDEPKPPPLSQVKPPSFLFPGAKREWKRIVPILDGLGLLSDLDVSALAGYCTAYDTWVTALGQIKKSGMLIQTPNGYFQPSPYIKISRDAQDEMMRWLKEFGMTPAARSRVSAPEQADEDDPLDNLIKMNQQ